MRWKWILLVLGTLLSTVGAAAAQREGTPTQTAEMVLNEARTVYLGNLARADNGVPPLRWNRQLTQAARWFSWDSVENRASPYCGHEDTLGRSPWERMTAFGYSGLGNAENVFCGYLPPEDAIAGWMASPGHRDNLLNTTSREVGLGYYRRASDGRGYVTQDFGYDALYPPMIIDNEALSTTTPGVQLYIYDRQSDASFAGMGPTSEMMVSNDPCFTGATWEPYNANRSWTLEDGTGWRAVYVATRDAVGRAVVASDTIYLGGPLPIEELDDHGSATYRQQVALYDLDGAELPLMQFSPHWFVDDTHSTFQLYWGNGGRVSDPAARGGTAFRLSPGDGNSFAWVWTLDFAQEIPLMAYFRLKVADNTAGEVLRVEVSGGGVTYGPLVLHGSDFAAPNTYYDFPLSFTYHQDSDPYLLFEFPRTGTTDVDIDGAYIFTAPQPVQSPYLWTVPGGAYRGRGIWVRYTDGGTTFSPIEEADRFLNRLQVEPPTLHFLAEAGGPSPQPQELLLQRQGCPFSVQVSATPADWLQVQRLDDRLQVAVSTAGLLTGTYHAEITLTAEGEVEGSPAVVPITLVVAQELQQIYLPLIGRGDRHTNLGSHR